MGHHKVTMTLGIYAHLFADDHSNAIVALGAMATPPMAEAGNVQRYGVRTVRPVIPDWGGRLPDSCLVTIARS
jgi:hypothetical protein